MPLKRTYSTSTELVPSKHAKKKRNLSKRSPWTRPKVQLLSAPGTPFPTRCRAQLKYTSYVNINVVTGLVGTQYIRCNSLFDPDATGIGGQPRGFDQYALLYDQYTVNSSKMKCWAVIAPQTNISNAASMLGVSIVDADTTTPSIDNCADRPFTNYKIVNAFAAQKDQTVTHSWNRLKRFPNAQTYQSLSSQIAANPVEQEYYQIWTYPALNPLGSDLDSLTIQYEVVYDIEFYELKQIPAS